jgi:sulfatase modifying factor 1
MREGAVMQTSRRGARAWPLVLASWLATTWAGACNTFTGASDYTPVAACTGSLCSLQCAAQGGTWKADTCLCAGDTPLCGGSEGSCCGGTAPHCVTSSSGAQQCSACTEAAYECGAVCCEKQTCLNATLGACGTAYGKARQSCAGGLVCRIPRIDGSIEDADCCETIAVPAETASMGLSANGRNRCPASYAAIPVCSQSADEAPAHPVKLGPYLLDRFEVTVGRFRKFVSSWDYNGLPDGAGGDAVVAGSGWQSAWNIDLPASKQDLEKDVACETALGDPVPQYATWTATEGSRESFPINCVTWYEAFAFCVWDGARLPTEAEWELAAANGPRADLYPWGEEVPTAELAVFCSLAGTLCEHLPSLPIVAVGSLPKGENQLGHRDMAGNVDEWTLDTWAPYPEGAVKNYADVSGGGIRTNRGGSFFEGPSDLRAAYRGSTAPIVVNPGLGVRCARSP